jgi:hypothetical protein
MTSDPLAQKAIADFAARHGVSVEIVADLKTFRDYLESSGRAGSMTSSTALELYCARTGLAEETVLEVAESYAQFDVWVAAEKAIDSAITGDGVAAMLDFVDAEYR